MSEIKTITSTIDADTPPELSEKTKRYFDTTPDDEIDYSESPDLGDVDWDTLDIQRPGRKPKVSMRVDDEVIRYFKGKDPEGYTARMAAVLKAYVDSVNPK